ncbi:extracellular solute-binding protein [Trinickia fusca]|uniref:Extracellular solute-binding protein n=1 Tax=Trinickia fusca TaxID=2419777 RepID=A0A494XJS9_9BURK|nr:extracellular solute-binding protein [Trinickia fusca]RKP50987.1 extracellular solute-binding protein [Trinickia fusca]
MKRPFVRLLSACCAALVCATAAADAAALTVYSVGPAPLIRRLAADFRQETGIEVDVFQGDTGQVLARLADKRVAPADVVILGSWDTALEMSRRGELLPYQPAGYEHIASAYRTPQFVAQGVATLALVWRIDSDTPRPEDWGDLAAPAYRDRIGTVDPAQSGSSLDLIAALDAQHGTDIWAMLAALRENGLTPSGSNAQAMDAVLKGGKAALFAVADHTALEDKAHGAPIEVIFPRSGTIATARPMMIMKQTREARDAKRFVDFVLSRKGQQDVADEFIIPARNDVAAERPGLDAIKLLPAPPAQAGKSGTSRDAVLKRFAALFSQ